MDAIFNATLGKRYEEKYENSYIGDGEWNEEEEEWIHL